MRKERRSIPPSVHSSRGIGLWFGLILSVCVLEMILNCDRAMAIGAHETPSAPARSNGSGTEGSPPVERGAAIARGSSTTSAGKNRVLPGDDRTFRPTVVIRRGTSQGSGTIIASIEGQTLVLTAAHVLKATGPISVQMHRYNVGRERTPALPGSWPREFPASLAAIDAAADLAILRIEKLRTLPYVARLAPVQAAIVPDSVVTSIGIDLGTKLIGWTTRIVETVRFELNDSPSDRLFVMTKHTPEQGRSGGGLFLANGDLVGVCVGHAARREGQRVGVFASHESIRQLLGAHDHLADLINRSERRRAQLEGRSSPAKTTVKVSARQNVNVTATRSLAEKLTMEFAP